MVWNTIFPAFNHIFFILQCMHRLATNSGCQKLGWVGLEEWITATFDWASKVKNECWYFDCGIIIWGFYVTAPSDDQALDMTICFSKHLPAILAKSHQLFISSEAYFTKEVNLSFARLPLNFNGGLARLGLTRFTLVLHIWISELVQHWFR